MPQYRNGVLVPLHGEGSKPIGPALPYRGGVFGQPTLPPGRTGIFKTHYALPWEDMVSDTSSRLPWDQYQMPSGEPYRFIVSKEYLKGKKLGNEKPSPEGVRPTKLQAQGGLCGCQGMGCPRGMGDVDLSSLVVPALLGAVVGYLVGKSGKGALAGAAGGAGAALITPAATTLVKYGLMGGGAYLAARMLTGAKK